MHNIHMLDRPYIQDILEHLQSLGYEPGKAKELLIQFYRSIKRIYGFYLNAREFAMLVHELNKAVHRKYDPTDSNQIFIGHLRGLI
ncbi:MULTISPECIES: hypothetical protein [Paenibacillus]|uniref:hypothetical protein n=1 Tax=Paenibacillus TaxID=44249 RepID=UPI00096FFE54|nr:hypothetical protein [Paenibacillus odorifer]OME32631.1 hypothetical protein BSK58_27995 [Paenibacillus odorifer]